MKNIFRRATVDQTDATIAQPNAMELDESELEQVTGGYGHSRHLPPPPPHRQPQPPRPAPHPAPHPAHPCR
jgi:hypothetical protein